MSDPNRAQAPDPQNEKIQEFVDELSGFAQTAEDTLKLIEKNLLANKGKFSVFTERMFAIRGTAQQLSLPRVADIARLGEEISVKATHAESRAQIRKCVGALWDALTTVKHLLVNYQEETGEEESILINRLNKTLEAFGGARPTIDESEIDALLNKRS